MLALPVRQSILRSTRLRVWRRVVRRVEIMSEPPLEAYEPYAERVMRSVAHNIGNVVNVISGRLSLLELQDGMGTEALEMIALMRDRLRRTQGELREAVRFVSETTSPSGDSTAKSFAVADALQAVLGDVPGHVEGLDSLRDERVRGCTSTQPLVLALGMLVSGLRKLFPQRDGVEWRLDANGEGLVLDLIAAAAALPADRRSLMEPWFDVGALGANLESRRGRLEFATALGRIEDGGGQISAAKEGADVSRVRLFWPNG